MQAAALLLLSWVVPAIGTVIPQYQIAHARAQPKITLPGGSVVGGVTDEKYPAVRQFLGIPYAEPPVGDLRWEPPRPNQLPSSVDATAYGRSCTQFAATQPNPFNTVLFEYNIRDINTTGEDCLTLSVWAPDDAKNVPVIVFLYGGGWATGGQDTPYHNPTQWVQRTKDLIIVVPK